MFTMNGNVSYLMRIIQNDERLLAIFRRFSDATPEEQEKYEIVTYEDTGRVDILYDGKAAPLPDKKVPVVSG